MLDCKLSTTSRAKSDHNSAAPIHCTIIGQVCNAKSVGRNLELDRIDD